MLNLQLLPGANCPYPSINALLQLDERFQIDEKNYLLQPKTYLNLQNLINLLKQEALSYQLFDEKNISGQNQLFLSLKNLTTIASFENSLFSVEGGCKVELLKNFLVENELEIGFSPFQCEKMSVAEYLVADRDADLKIRGQTFKNRVLALELIDLQGNLLKFGFPFKGNYTGLVLQQLICKLSEVTNALVKIFFEAVPIPDKRLFLKWSFENWQKFHQLRNFTTTWERFDALVPPNPKEEGFILAQISGTAEEMKTFLEICPKGFVLKEKDATLIFRTYFDQQKAHYERFQGTPLTPILAADYLWYHGLAQFGFIIHLDKKNQSRQMIEQPLWKKNVLQALLNISDEK